MSSRHTGDEALTARTAAIAARHISGCAGFVDEDQAFRVQVGLARAPLIASLGDIRSILLSGSFRPFLKRQTEKFEPVPQATDADLDLVLGRKPRLQFLQRRIGMSGHPCTKRFIVPRKLRFASRTSHTRRPLTAASATPNDLGHIGNADQKQSSRGTNARSSIYRRNHSFTQIL
jgi:hypothetical protein